MAGREAPLAESDARQLAFEYREKFRNSEVFEAAWNALFELKSAITPHLARRFLGEELLKYRAHVAGLQEPPPEAPPPRPGKPATYRCAGCQRQLQQWSRDGHGAGCRNENCYELEVRFREGKLHEPKKKARVFSEESERVPDEKPDEKVAAGVAS